MNIRISKNILANLSEQFLGKTLNNEIVKKIYFLFKIFSLLLLITALNSCSKVPNSSIESSNLPNKFSVTVINQNVRFSDCKNYLQKIVDRISKYNNFNQNIDLFLVENKSAFALSREDSTIEISKNFLNIFDNDNEIAFILAHEIAHILLNHHNLINNVEKNKLTEILNEYTNQKIEVEADQYAVKLITNSGFSPQGATTALLKAQKINFANSNKKFLNNDENITHRIMNLYSFSNKPQEDFESKWSSRDLYRCKLM